MGAFRMEMKKILIASDHGGFTLKQKIIKELDEKYDFEDLGAYEEDSSDDYPDFAIKVSEKISKNPKQLGILLCRSASRNDNNS